MQVKVWYGISQNNYTVQVETRRSPVGPGLQFVVVLRNSCSPKYHLVEESLRYAIKA